MRFVLISDTHVKHGKLKVPDGDVLIHAGDMTGRGDPNDVVRFNSWLGTLPHPTKIVIAGNHDFCFVKDLTARDLLTNATYLQDSGVTVGGLKIWGAPWQPWFYNWAFNIHRGKPIKEKWDLIPQDTDILVTHGPPKGILDLTDGNEFAGCEELLLAVQRVRPKLHVFGHIHEGYGLLYKDGIQFANASTCTLQYKPTNPPLIVDVV